MLSIIKYVLLLFLTALSIVIYAQTNLDEIFEDASNLPTAEQPAFLNKSAEIFFQKNLKFADSLCSKALEIAIEINNEELIAQSHKYLSFIKRNMGYNSEALTNAIESNNLYVKLNDSLEVGFTYNLIGSIYTNLGDKESALESFISSEKVFQKLLLGDPEDRKLVSRLAILYNDIGLFYFNMINDFDLSRSYFEQAYILANKIDDSMQIVSLVGNIGMTYFNQKDYTSAVEYYEKALNMAKDRGYERFAANTLNNIGLCYIEEGKIKLAREYFTKTLKIYEKLHLVYYFGKIHNSIADTWRLENNYKMAIPWYMEAINSLKMSSAYPELITTYLKLSDCYSSISNSDSAYYYLKKYTVVSDSINKIENENKYQELLVEFETNKKDKENQLLKLSNQKQKNIQIFLIVFILIIILITVLMLLNFRQYKKNLLQKKFLADQEQENLKMKLECKNKELTTNAMYLVNLNLLSESIIQKIKDIIPTTIDSNKSALNDIVREIELNIQKDAWKEFEIRFNEVHTDFYNRLLKLHPNLSPTEIKTCAFLRLNMTSKDIAALTFKSHRTVEKSRTDIRKKMKLTTETNLVTYLLGV